MLFTTTYGERWIPQLLLATVINFAHVLTVATYTPGVLLRNVVDVDESNETITSAFIGYTNQGAPGWIFSIWFAVLIIAVALWVVIIVIFARLGIRRNIESEESEGAA
jgi:hypothetical protein